jgi:hypothetical protein
VSVCHRLPKWVKLRNTQLECESAWGPYADRHAKLLIRQAVVGSFLDAYLHPPTKHATASQTLTRRAVIPIRNFPSPNIPNAFQFLATGTRRRCSISLRAELVARVNRESGREERSRPCSLRAAFCKRVGVFENRILQMFLQKLLTSSCGR